MKSKIIIFFALFITLFSSSYSQVNLTNGLIAYYPFNGNPNDVTGNGHNGQLQNNIQLTTDRFGNSASAYVFDGIDDYIKVPDDGAFSTPQFSLVIWFQTQSNGLQNLIGKRNFNTSNGSGGAQYQFFINYPPFPGIGSNIVGNTSSCSVINSSSYINTNDIICTNRWYFAVITFDGANHKIYIDGVLRRNMLAPFTGMVSCKEDLRIGNWFALDLIPFKGKIDDIRWYDRALNQQEIDSLYGNYINPTSSADFSFSQSTCNPNQISFTNSTQGIQSSTWFFGDGASATGNNVTHNYSLFGTYSIKLIVQYVGGCIDSTIKLISLTSALDPSLITTKDTTICAGENIPLNTSNGGLNYCWFPSGSLSNANSLNPIATLAASTTFFFTSQIPEANLILNGDFSQGNAGFVSDYTSVFPNTSEGQYWVDINPTLWNPSMSNCKDHSSGSGKMMLVNAANQIGAKVWSQIVNVLPNTNYAFSLWIQSLIPSNPAQLNFSINNIALGTNINASTIVCQWNRFYTVWNSGSNTTALIAIANNNSVAQGNDFALDDISFSALNMKYDSVTINITTPPDIKTIADTTICQGGFVQLDATGGTAYSWSPPEGLSNVNIPNPIATPAMSIRYIVTGISGSSCGAKDTISINVNSKPLISVGNDISICKGDTYQIPTNSTDALLYSWSPLIGLSNASVSNPIASPSMLTEYILTATSSTGCLAKDTIKIDVRETPVILTSNDTTICQGSSVQLNTTGGNVYTWFPSTGLSNPFIPNPLASPSGSMQYIVTGTNNVGCENRDTININLLNIPVITISNDTVICTGTTLQIFSNSPDAAAYKWYPNIGLSASNIPDPYFFSNTTISYYLLVTGNNGCIQTDSIKIIVDPKPHVLIIKSNDIDCFYGQAQLISSGGFRYKWAPVIGLSNPGISNPIARPITTTNYVVSVYSPNGCIAKDSISINVTKAGANGFWVASGFTPNNDGVNDCFGIKNWGRVEYLRLEVYNRWGQLVFFSNDPAECWDGSFKGEQQPIGVYIYQIKAKTFCGDVYRKGTITLIR